MIKKTVFEEELYNNMLDNLQLKKTASSFSNEDNLENAIDYLNCAAEIFEEYNMGTQSDNILNIIVKVAGFKENINKYIEEALEDFRKNPEKYKKPLHFDIKPIRTKEELKEPKDGEYIEFKSIKDKLPSDDNFAKKTKKVKKPSIKEEKADHHTKGLTPEKMVKNILHHGTPFNMCVDENNIELEDFEDER
jgi:hypothetical protein